MNGPFEEYMGSMIVCDKGCCDMVSITSLLSSDVSTFPGDKTPGERIYDNWIPVGGCVLRQKREFRESFFLNFLFQKCLQFKVITVTRWHILGEYILKSNSRILKWHILLPFNTELRPFQKVTLYANVDLVGNCKH